MADGEILISGMTPDSSVTGVELIPVADGGTARSVSVTNIKDFTISQIEAIAAAGSVSGADSVFILQGGALTPVDIDLVAQHAIDTIWGKAAEAAPDNDDVMPLLDGTGDTEKTVTLAVLSDYVRATIEPTILDISDLSDGSGSLTSTDYILVTQGTTGRRVQLSNINAAIYAALSAYVVGLAAVTVSADADVFYCIQGGTEKKVALSTLKSYFLPASSTLDNLAQFSNTSGNLKDGPGIATTVASPGVDTSLPTEQAVREALSTVVYDQADIGADLVDADVLVVDDGNLGTTQRKSALSRLWTYVTGKIQGLAAKATPLAADILTIQDTADSNALKKLTLAELKAHLENVGTYDWIWVPATDMTPTTTNGAAAGNTEYATNDLQLAYQAFDGVAQDEHVCFQIAMPPSWDRGTIKYKVLWVNGHADANADEFVRFYMAAGALGNDDAIDTALGTAVYVEDQHIADDDLHTSPASEALTVAGTPALGDMLMVKLSRDYDYAGTGVPMDVDAWVVGVVIQYQKTNSVSAW